MPVFHATLFFAHGKFGWVEQFHRTDSSLASAMQASMTLAESRYSILASPYNLYRVRVSQVGAPRVSASAPVSGTTLNVPGIKPLEAAEIRLAAYRDRFYYRTFLLRGLPASALARVSDTWQFSGPFGVLAQRWLSQLVSGGWHIQAWGRATQQIPINSLSNVGYPPADLVRPDLPPQGELPLSPGIECYVGQDVQLPAVNLDTGAFPTARLGRVGWTTTGKGFRNGINGEYEVSALGDGVIVLMGSLPWEGGWTGGGYVQLRPRIYVGITGFTLVRQTVKAVGRAPVNLGPPPGTGFSLSSLTQLGSALVAPFVNPLTALFEVLKPCLAPAGTWSGPVTPVEPPPPPPPPPGPFVEDWQPARPVTLRNLSDIAVWMCQTMAFENPEEVYQPIQIAKVGNLVNTYVVFLYGFDGEFASGTGALNFLANAIHAPNAYLTAASNAIERFIPGDAQMLIVGYSLGGIVAELLYADPDYTERIIAVLTLAAPMAGVLWIRPVIFRYGVAADPVLWLTPMSSLARFFGVARVLNLFVRPWYLLPADSAYPFPFTNHTRFPLHPKLAQFDTFGQPFLSSDWRPLPISNSPPLQLEQPVLLPVDT